MSDVGLLRAGFWRRAGASFLDLLIIMVPIEVLLAVAFALTNGAVQGAAGVTSTICYAFDVTPELLAQIPNPPEGANVVRYCRTGLLGLDTSNVLIVGVRTEPASSGTGATTEVTTSYPMNSRREFVNATDLSLPAYLVMIVAIIWQWARSGRTLGGRILRLRVVRVARPSADAGGTMPVSSGGIGWWVATKRFVLSCLVNFFWAPGLLLVLGLFFWMSAIGQPGLAKIALFALIPIGIGQLVLLLMILTDIVQRRDPIYDRWAGTAAVVE
jgi:hypothetical protein